MMYLLYDNAPPDTQTMMSIVTIISAFALMFGAFYFWAKDKLKKMKK
jgi:hypothetical protein